MMKVKVKIQRPSVRVERERLVKAIILIILVGGLAVYGYFVRTGRISPILELKPQPAGLVMPQISQEKTPAIPEEAKEILEEVSLAPQTSQSEAVSGIEEIKTETYFEVAEPGEGITHLARKALREYLQKKGTGVELTPAHKIYIEDYIQNRIGDRWLQVGEKIEIQEELIKEAIEKAQGLSQQDLENLKHFADLVPELNY